MIQPRRRATRNAARAPGPLRARQRRAAAAGAERIASLGDMHRHRLGIAQTAARAKPAGRFPAGRRRYGNAAMDGEKHSVEVAVVGGGPAGPDRGRRAGGRRRRDRADRASAAAGQPHHGAAGPVRSPRWRRSEVWPLCRDNAAPLTAIRLIDDTRRLIRAPEVHVRGERDRARGVRPQHREPPSDRGARPARARACQSLRRIDAAVDGGRAATMPASTIRLDDGATIAARLVVGADGRKSLCRAAAGIETDRRDYPQAALTLNLAHTRPHNGISTEFHTETGPFTLVPLPGLRSSLVCVVEPDEAERLAALDAAALSAEIERRSHSILGKVHGRSRPRPVSARRRDRALVRGAAHRAGRRSRACDPADRRAGPQPRPARRRDHRRACGRGAPRRPRCRRATTCSRATTACAAPT